MLQSGQRRSPWLLLEPAWSPDFVLLKWNSDNIKDLPVLLGLNGSHSKKRFSCQMFPVRLGKPCVSLCLVISCQLNLIVICSAVELRRLSWEDFIQRTLPESPLGQALSVELQLRKCTPQSVLSYYTQPLKRFHKKTEGLWTSNTVPNGSPRSWHLSEEGDSPCARTPSLVDKRLYEQACIKKADVVSSLRYQLICN